MVVNNNIITCLYCDKSYLLEESDAEKDLVFCSKECEENYDKNRGE